MGRLVRLAAAHGVSTSYEPVPGRTVQVSDVTVVAVLGALGVDASTPQAIRAPGQRRVGCLATATTHDLPSTAARLSGEQVASPRLHALLADLQEGWGPANATPHVWRADPFANLEPWSTRMQSEPEPSPSVRR